MGAKEMDSISGLIDSMLRKVEVVNNNEYNIDGTFKEQINTKVKDLWGSFGVH